MASVEERLVEVLQRVARKDLYWLLEETLVAYEQRRTQTDMEPGEARQDAIEVVLDRIEKQASTNGNQH